MFYRRAQASAAMRVRLLSVLDRECRPQDMLPLRRLIGWLLGEVIQGRLSSFRGFGRTLRNAVGLARQQAQFDRELAAVERDAHASG